MLKYHEMLTVQRRETGSRGLLYTSLTQNLFGEPEGCYIRICRDGVNESNIQTAQYSNTNVHYHRYNKLLGLQVEYSYHFLTFDILSSVG
jgi:hypothetical protein